jgi:hypothetical protein
MVVCDVWSSRVYKTLDDKYAVDEIMVTTCAVPQRARQSRFSRPYAGVTLQTSSLIYVFEVPNFDASRIKPKMYSYNYYSSSQAAVKKEEEAPAEPEAALVQVVHQRTKPNVYYGKYPNEREFEVEAFGTPFVIPVAPNAKVRKRGPREPLSAPMHLTRVQVKDIKALIKDNARRFHAPGTEPYSIVCLDTYSRWARSLTLLQQSLQC